MKDKKINFLARISLLFCCLIWAFSFAVEKTTVKEIPVFTVTMITSLGAMVIFGLLSIPIRNQINIGSAVLSMICGIPLVMGAFLTKITLQYTTVANVSFISQTYVVIVPFISWLFFKRKPKVYTFISIPIILTGLGVLAFKDGSFSFNLLGDGLCFLSAVCYAFNLVIVEYLTKIKKIDARIQQLFRCVVGFVVGLMGFLISEQGKAIFSPKGIGGIFYMVLLSSVVGNLLASWGIKHTSSIVASVIYSLESVFATIFGVLVFNETLVPLSYVAFSLIFIGVIVSEVIPLLIAKRDQVQISKVNIQASDSQ